MTELSSLLAVIRYCESGHKNLRPDLLNYGQTGADYMKQISVEYSNYPMVLKYSPK